MHLAAPTTSAPPPFSHPTRAPVDILQDYGVGTVTFSFFWCYTFMLFRLLGPALLFTATALAAPLDDALALYKDKKYPDARAAFEKIVAAEPTNAAAAHYLGLTLVRRGDNKALEESLPWLEKATTLDPKNATYLAEFGKASLQFGGNTTSISAATKGRDALEKSLALDGTNLDAREALFQFYDRAPWPIGSSSKANAQLAEIRKIDPNRAVGLEVNMKVAAKKYPEAFKILETAIAKTPDNYAVLYAYGRAAAISDLNLATGLTHLKKCLTLTPPTPVSPTHSNVWNRIGNIQEKLKNAAEARTAYETALKLDPTNKQASDSLAKLK